MSEKGFRVEIPVNFNRRAPKVPQKDPPFQNEFDDVPRIARLLALAHKWEGMVRRGSTSMHGLAQRHGLSAARVSQVCGLTLLSPRQQQSILNGGVPSKRIRLTTAVRWDPTKLDAWLHVDQAR